MNTGGWSGEDDEWSPGHLGTLVGEGDVAHGGPLGRAGGVVVVRLEEDLGLGMELPPLLRRAAAQVAGSHHDEVLGGHLVNWMSRQHG